MSIEVHWADAKQTIVHFAFSQNWTWEEFHTANRTSRTMLESVEHSVDIILELALGANIPPRVLGNLTQTLRERPPINFNRVILIGSNGLVKNLTNVLRTLYPAQMARVIEAQTFEHALRLLNQKAKTGTLA